MTARRRQSGIAAITAVLIVAVAASAAAVMLAQQSATLDQARLIASRAQADQYALAGLDWARGVLAEDLKSAGSIDSLDEGWAQPMVGLPVERAMVAGAIADEQGKFNLNNLVNAAGQASAPDLLVFQRLLSSLGLAPELAQAVQDWIDADDDLAGNAGAEDAYYLALPRPYRAANAPMAQVEELYRVRGFDAPTVAKLRPYVTALDRGTLINVNTASVPVLAAVLGDKVGTDQVARLMERRKLQPFRTTAEIPALIGTEATPALAMLDVKSAFFSVLVQVNQDDVQLSMDALVRRTPPGSGGVPGATLVWRRTRT
ncbi:MAG TPA: type II secretion system minor pseudopilin GspK [Usitatibacter sp.]|jgi:general secretion pathway protein K|nr:type II secretion system minor pseudopilin GspK [Usitatibacter sp.]